MEEYEDDLLEIFAEEGSGLTEELCVKRSSICKPENLKKDEL